MLTTSRPAYSAKEIEEMKAECIDLWDKIFNEKRTDQSERFNDLKTCLSQLGHWYAGGKTFYKTDGTDTL